MTLLELLIAMLVLAALLGISVPACQSLVLDMRRTAAVNAFVSSVQLARNESNKRTLAVVVCKSIDTLECTGDEIGFESGWMIFVNEDGVEPAHRHVGEALIWLEPERPPMTVRSNRQRFYFRPFNRRSTNGTVTFCDARGADAARAVIVSSTGRPRVSGEKPGGGALSCGSSVTE